MSAHKPRIKPADTPLSVPAPAEASGLLGELRRLIDEARQRAAAAINSGQTALYWRVGKRIATAVLGGQRAACGVEIVATLWRQLVAEYGRGFEEKNLRRRVQFAQVYGDAQKVAALWRQLSWSHFRLLRPLKDPLAQAFYAERCRLEGWRVRTLQARVDFRSFDLSALSAQPDALTSQELDTLHTQGDVTPALLIEDPQVLSPSTCCSTTASCAAWWRWSWASSRPSTGGRWRCACAGWPATTRSRATARHWASSRALARSRRRPGCWNWTSPAPTWSSTSPCCRPAPGLNNSSKAL